MWEQNCAWSICPMVPLLKGLSPRKITASAKKVQAAKWFYASGLLPKFQCAMAVTTRSKVVIADTAQ